MVIRADPPARKRIGCCILLTNLLLNRPSMTNGLNDNYGLNKATYTTEDRGMSDLNILLEELERQQYEEESDPNLLEDSIIALKKLEAERDVLKHELEEALQEISGLKQCDCIVRGAE